MAHHLLELRQVKTDSSLTVKDMLDPHAWNDIILAMKMVCKYENITNIGIPFLVLKMGHSLKSIAELLIRNLKAHYRRRIVHL